MSRALVAVISMVSRARRIVSLVRGLALGALLLDHADLNLDDLEGVVQLHVADAVRCAAFTDHAGAAVVHAAGRRRPARWRR